MTTILLAATSRASPSKTTTDMEAAIKAADHQLGNYPNPFN